MARRITAATLILAAACGTQLRLGDTSALSYAQYKILEEGMEARSVLKAFGKPGDVLEQDGRIRGLTYLCENATGVVEQLRMVFTPEERLDRWTLGGAPTAKPVSG